MRMVLVAGEGALCAYLVAVHFPSTHAFVALAIVVYEAHDVFEWIPEKKPHFMREFATCASRVVLLAAIEFLEPLTQAFYARLGA